jgi:hypothetical protein
MLTIPVHKGKANQYHTDSSSVLLELLPSRTPTKNVGKDAGNKEHAHTGGGNVS